MWVIPTMDERYREAKLSANLPPTSTAGRTHPRVWPACSSLAWPQETQANSSVNLREQNEYVRHSGHCFEFLRPIRCLGHIKEEMFLWEHLNTSLLSGITSPAWQLACTRFYRWGIFYTLAGLLFNWLDATVKLLKRNKFAMTPNSPSQFMLITWAWRHLQM